MEELIAIVVGGAFLVAFLVVVPAMAITAWSRSSKFWILTRRLAILEAEVARLAQIVAYNAATKAGDAGDSAFGAGVASSEPPPTPAASAPPPWPATASAAAAELPERIFVATVASSQPSSTTNVTAASGARGDAVPSAGAPFESLPPSPPARGQPAGSMARSSVDMEMLIGRQALGWLSVVVLLFATGFFLKYAYENQWIGPLGRVTVGIFGGSALILAGWRYHGRGWQLFSEMLTSGGVVVLYLATYSAFGFYNLIPQQAAGVFLALLAAQCALLALRYNSQSIGLMAVIGGLITPLLMVSERDQYVSLFVYLGVVTAGSLALLAMRSWLVIGTVCLLGTQILFWMWAEANYHPEKRWWAIGFQAVLFLLHAGQVYVASTSRRRGPTWEDVIRVSLNAGAAFLAVRWLLNDEFSLWHGSVAMLFAAFHGVFARAVYTRMAMAGSAIASSQAAADRIRAVAGGALSGRVVLVSIGIATGFIALALPLQASTSWSALGWATQASVLWWFGNRVDQRPLRAFAAILALMAGVQIALVDIPSLALVREHGRPRLPVLNVEAAPVMATIACLLAGLYYTRNRVKRGLEPEITLSGIGFVLCLLAIWLAVSFDLYGWFRPGGSFVAVSATDAMQEPGTWRRMAGMTISSWWTIYASLLLALGFSVRVSAIRWTALAIFAATIAKVFLFDMADLDQIYRIVAFFVLAVFLGIAAWAYQRIGLKQTHVLPEESPWP